jgi:hypothetical protein
MVLGLSALICQRRINSEVAQVILNSAENRVLLQRAIPCVLVPRSLMCHRDIRNAILFSYYPAFILEIYSHRLAFNQRLTKQQVDRFDHQQLVAVASTLYCVAQAWPTCYCLR